jgi:hypothetical protein
MAKEPSVLDQLKALDEQRAKLMESAKSAALEKANEAIEELNALGFNYRLAEGPVLARVLRAKTEGETPNRKPKDADCPICNFRTNPPHDRRSHRNQERKKPFTAKELEERGLVRV